MRLPGGSPLVREWIILAICLGFGGHMALGVILHARELWSLKDAGLNGLMAGLGFYLVIQLLRALWWAIKGVTKSRPGARKRPA